MFIDEFTGYTIHHTLFGPTKSNSVSLEAQRVVENLKWDSLALPKTQSCIGSAFVSMEFCIVLKENCLALEETSLIAVLETGEILQEKTR
jgi:hypothetical protein